MFTTVAAYNKLKNVINLTCCDPSTKEWGGSISPNCYVWSIKLIKTIFDCLIETLHVQ